MPRVKPTEVVQLSPCAFTVWWLILLAVHWIVAFYNAVYGYYYWDLPNRYFTVLTVSFGIGLPPEDDRTIAIIHVIMAVLHGVCILLMLGGSIWRRSLSFTPWASCDAKVIIEEVKPERTSSAIVRSFNKVFDTLSDRHGLLGINGKHFHAIQVCREIVETALQTRQAYRMSTLLPRTLLNRFYVILIALNCWSPAIVDTWLFKGDEARKRHAIIVLDCALGLMACVGVEIIVVSSYAGDFNLQLGGFNFLTWFNDEWMARAYNELQMVIVVSWMDLASRSFFSLGLIATTTNMKELLQRLPQKKNRVIQSVFNAPTEKDIGTAKAEQDAKPPSRSRFLRHYDSKLLARVQHLTLHSAHILFVIWGAVVLGFHIQASTQPLLPQCLIQVRPWATSRPSCYLADLDCYTLGISGLSDEVDAKWSEFDSFTVVQMLIRHCPTLEVPARFSEFHSLRGMKVYNSTVVEWGDSAALTKTNHPTMLSFAFIRVNLTDGAIPAGFLSADFPPTVYDVTFIVTNLRDLPDDLDSKWAQNILLQLEYCQLTEVYDVLIRLQPGYLALTGNPITELPSAMFEIDNTYLIGISDMDINELPRNVTKLSASLAWVFMREVNVSFFWDWADELVERMTPHSPWIAGYSTYCEDLAKIENGTATAFRVPLSPQYSQTLMDPSEKNLQVIGEAVNCKSYTKLPSGGGMFHPLFYEDSINAISTPPALMRPTN